MVMGTATTLPVWAEAYNAHRPLENKAFLSVCYAPYVNLDFSPNGEVFVCCVNTNYAVGRIPEDTILGIWRGERIRQLREHLKRYDFSLDCERCRWHVDLGNLAGVFAKSDDRYAVPQDPPGFPTRMDFRLSNTCNFACIMCSGDYSSLIRTREGRAPFKKVYDEGFFEQFEECLPHLEEAKFTGGEPFLVKENFRIWDLIIKHGSRVSCWVTTNGSVMNERVVGYLEQLRFQHIGISFDGATKETFEAIRQEGSFEQVLHNVKVFKRIADQQGHTVRFQVCPMRQNWREFPDIVRLAEDLGCPVNVNIVWNPPSCSLYELPREEITRIRAYLQDRFECMRSSITEESRMHWWILIESLMGAEARAVERPFAHQALVGKS